MQTFLVEVQGKDGHLGVLATHLPDFAQELKTPFPVSYKRLEKVWSDLDR